MIFKIVIFPYSEKRGLQLLDEYERLAFPENQQTNTFQCGPTPINVPAEAARMLSDVFGDSTTAYFRIDSTLTAAEAWEEDGYNVMRLKNINLSSALNKMLTTERARLEHKKSGFDSFFERGDNNNPFEQQDEKIIQKTFKQRGLSEQDIKFAISYTRNKTKIKTEIEELKNTKMLELVLSVVSEPKP